MSRQLPPRPNLKQLKHQAKDLLRAHASGEPSVCEPLKLLRRFAKASDEEILAADLALHEAQYALAMEYGFASWNALKRHVEKVTGRPSPVRREKDRTYVTGLEKHGIGCKDAHDNSVIACIAGVMSAMGEDDLTYEYLMGASGAAFRVQMAEPNWCPSAACAECGYDCVPGAMAATGYRLIWIDTQRDGKWLRDGVEKALRAVPASIDRGAPVIVAGKESGLVVGYRADGKLVVRPYEFQQEGYRDVEVFDEKGEPKWVFGDCKWDDWVWAVGVVEPRDVPMDRRQAIANSLRLAVKLAKTERFGNYLSGFAALDHWAIALLDDSRFDSLTEDNWFPIAHGNGYCYPCLWSARFNVEKYLRKAADSYEDPIRSELLELAGLYQQMHQALAGTKPEFDCIWSLQPWILKTPADWTHAIRQKESDLLREALAIERMAVAKIEVVLPLLDAAPAREGSRS